jgi:transcriptional regulator with XRE-family HTH domain
MFSNWLLFNLAEASLTQKQFAKLVNVNQETVSRWITGRHYPQAIYRARICKIFAELIPHKTYDQLMKELR